MNKTNIEWVKNPDGSQGYTWNPITGCLNHVNGLCKGGGFPCYAYKLAHGRLKERYLRNQIFPVGQFDDAFWRDTPLSDPFYPRFWPERLDDIKSSGAWWDTLRGRKPKGIFVCDMGELFGNWLPKEWQQQVFEVINPLDSFYLLTKQPRNLFQFSPFPENCWVGVTATNPKMLVNAQYHLKQIEACIKYISFEPLLERIGVSIHKTLKYPYYFDGINWVIIGACTGTLEDIKEVLMLYPQLTPMPYGKKWTLQPKIEWVQEIVKACDKAEIPVFLKDNLRLVEALGKKSIDRKQFFVHSMGHGGELRQELPDGR